MLTRQCQIKRGPDSIINFLSTKPTFTQNPREFTMAAQCWLPPAPPAPGGEGEAVKLHFPKRVTILPPYSTAKHPPPQEHGLVRWNSGASPVALMTVAFSDGDIRGVIWTLILQPVIRAQYPFATCFHQSICTIPWVLFVCSQPWAWPSKLRTVSHFAETQRRGHSPLNFWVSRCSLTPGIII